MHSVEDTDNAAQKVNGIETEWGSLRVGHAKGTQGRRQDREQGDGYAGRGQGYERRGEGYAGRGEGNAGRGEGGYERRERVEGASWR